MRLLVPLALVVLAGCRVDPPKDGSPEETGSARLDLDGDGYTDEEGDCDDADANVRPDATELCNGLDDDCDSRIDEDVEGTYYADTDGDGFGDPEAAVNTCSPPSGYVASGTDCDDTNAEAYPSNAETCDGIDNDCDGLVDDGVTTTFYADADLDGHGDPAAALPSCDPPAGSVPLGDDCDDSNASAFPGNPEVCDEHDNDCNGAVDEGVTTTWFGDLDADGFGDAALVEEACDAPVGYAATDDDCDDAAAAVFPGATEVCNGDDDDCDGTVDEADAADALAWYADADADGWGAGGAVRACEAPGGYVGDGTDCDDGRAATHPTATESCNGDDDDCDGTVDEADAAGAPTWYLDYDGDGWGGARFTSVGCAAPAGYVASASDCDDADASTSPSEHEVCDGYDEDCSGLADDGDVCPCDVDWYDDHAYQFCETATTWAAASDTCAAYGYHLVTVDSSAEDAWLVSVATTTYASTPEAYWWTGFNDQASEGTWVWEDGSPVTWTQWNSLEPNNSGGEDCGQLIWGTHWNDWPCELASTFVCEAD